MRLLRQMRERYSIRPTVDEMRAGAQHSQLRRSIGWIQLTALGVGAIVGAGVFSVIGTAAATAGPAIVISFLIAAAVALITAVVYAELATLIPASGSAYTYGYAAGGELFAWLVGWALILSYGIGNAALASSFSDNLTGLLSTFNIHIPHAWTAALGVNGPNNTQGILDLPALLVTAIITILLLRPIKESATANTILVTLKLGVLALFLLIAIPNANTANLTPFNPAGTTGILGGAALVFFAFLGFDAISTTAEEVRNPQRDLPRGIIGSLLITTILFIAIALALTALAHYNTLNTGEPLAVALRAAGYPWLAAIMNIGGLVAALTVLLVFQLATIRIVLALCRDGLLPNTLARVTTKHATPNRLTLLLGLLVGLAAALTPLGILVLITNVATLFIFAAAMYAVLRLRKLAPHAPRPFRTPLMPWLPILGILASAALAALAIYQDAAVGIGFLAWMGLGLMIYAAYGASRSLLRARTRAQTREHAAAGADARPDAGAEG